MSALTDVIICNLALSRVGSRVVLTATPTASDATEDGRACSRFYANCLKRALRDFDWGEVSKWAALAGQIDSDDTDGAGADAPWKGIWSFAYTYPSDCLMVREFKSADGRTPPERVPFEIGQHAAAVKIFCDLDTADAIIRYTAYVAAAATPTELTDEQGSVVAWLLAYELAMPLAVDPKLRADCWQHYRQALAEARAAAGTEQQRDPNNDGDMVRSRQ